MPPPALTVAVATIGFAAAFWVWALVAALGPDLSHRYGLSSVQQGLLVGTALFVGSLGRVPVGVLTDRYGARLMVPVVSLASAVSLTAAAFAQSALALVAVACAFGAAGTMFAAAAALVSRSCPPGLRGRALGVLGAGVAGVAVAAVASPNLAHAGDSRTVFLLAAAVLAAFAAVAAAVVRDGPNPSANPSMRGAVTAALRVPEVPRLAALSALACGSMIATAMFLPAYLRSQYGADWRQAMLGTAVFVAVVAGARPLGGWLVDRHPAALVLAGGFGLAGGCALVQAFAPPLGPPAAMSLAGVAVGLGAASGAVLALIGVLAPRERVGAVAGTVGVVGGVAGLVPPLLMAGVYAVDGSFGIALTVLSAMLLAAATHLRARPEWIDAPSAPAPALPAAGPGPTVITVGWPDLHRNVSAVATALAAMARHHELLIVHGCDGTPTHQSVHVLVAALRQRLPRHRIAATLVDTSPYAGRADTDLIRELLNDGWVTVAVTASPDPGEVATILADRIDATRLLRLTTSASGRFALASVPRPTERPRPRVGDLAQ
jgi:NNP family nitrate/nitrite transporter-like MFS transporter